MITQRFSLPRNFLAAALSIGMVLISFGSASAEVVRFEITKRESFADGRKFGNVGAYQRIIGKAYFAIDPKAACNQTIVDLSLAPRNDQGQVEFSCDLFILAPLDPRKGNRAVLYDVNNRGNKLAMRFFNDAGGGNDPNEGGNGFLMRNGYTLFWSGWDGELLRGGNRMRLSAPTAYQNGANRKTKSITGRVRYEFLVNKASKRESINRANHGAYRPSQAGMQQATLTWRLRSGDPRRTIPRDQFTIHVSEPKEAAVGDLPQVDLELPAGFQKGTLYELIYEAKDPLVHGVCFASLRDLIASLKHGGGENHPLLIDGKPLIERAHGFGVSQSGRFLREYLYWGFNIDEQGRKVFDGLIPHVAGGGLGSFNHRFAQPTAYVTQHEHHDWPTDRFPFSYETQKDPLTGRTDGILRRSAADHVVPYILHTQSATEYWSRSGSLPHTDPLGTHDAVPPESVRFFAFGGTQHGPADFPPKQGKAQTLANPGDYRPQLRALLTALDAWAKDNQPAPASLYPRLADKTLANFRQTGFPAIPGVRYPEVMQQPPLLNLGPRWLSDGIIDYQPPRQSKFYQALVPRCGPDGNELGCLLPAEVAVPLATFTGWSLRSNDPGPRNELVGLAGSYIPLPLTKAERTASGDPRLSLQERYGDLEGYLKQLTTHCRKMAEKRYLLEEDVQRIFARQKDRATPLFEKIKATP